MELNKEWMRNNTTVKVALFLFWGLVSVLATFGFFSYSGHGYVYVLFTIVSNLLLYIGFRKKSTFFDTFIGIFFWLGFWLKLTIRVTFFGGIFNQAVGSFDGTGAAFDRALLVSSCGLFGLLLASFFREKLACNYPQKIEGISQQGLFDFYQNHRRAILIWFVALFVIIAVSNVYLGIYQRGCITRTTLPYGLNGVYKWLLLFGLASFSALILRFEFELNKKTSFLVIFLSLMESFFSNISLLSRGMILNSSALLYGVFASLKVHSIKSNVHFFLISFFIFGTLFVSSVFVVNYLRVSIYSGDLNLQVNLQSIQSKTTPLYLDRWVGMEGVMAVSSYPKLGWDLWKTAWNENYNENETSFYDNNFIESPYEEADKTKHHFISLPGIIAFFFYPGSFFLLFSSMFTMGALGSIIETFVFKFGGKNVILCSLIAQVVAYRYAHFGYVPKQSYLLFGAIFLNLIIIYLADKTFLHVYRKLQSSPSKKTYKK